VAKIQEDKYIVIKKNHLDRLLLHQLHELDDILAKLSNTNSYWVCNQDEPYAQKVIDIILQGEFEKERE